jgi:hypothetical protein
LLKLNDHSLHNKHKYIIIIKKLRAKTELIPFPKKKSRRKKKISRTSIE